MKTSIAVLTQPGQFEIQEQNIETTENQVLIKVAACGLCMYESYHFKGKIGTCPQILGHEAAGVVEAVGSAVKGFAKGDRVTGFAEKCFATYAAARPEVLVKVPDSVTLEHALGEPLTCCVTSVRAATPEIGDYVLLTGCGAMGLLTLSGIAGKGCADIIAVDLVESRLALARELGATVTLNPSEVDAETEVMRMTGGRGVDVAVEASGAAPAFDLCAKTLRECRARLIVVGYHGEPATYNLSHLCRGTIVHTTHPGYSPDTMDDLRRAMIALEKGVFPMDRIVSHRFALEDIQQGFEAMIAKSDGYVKGIVVP